MVILCSAQAGCEIKKQKSEEKISIINKNLKVVEQVLKILFIKYVVKGGEKGCTAGALFFSYLIFLITKNMILIPVGSE